MKVRKIAAKGLLLAMALLSSGCLFKIQGNSSNTFPIQNDGSVDMTAASIEDVNSMQFTGLFLQGPNFYDVELLCASKFEEGFYQSIAYSQNAVVSNLYNTSSPEFQSKIKTLCKLTQNNDDNYELNLAIKISGLYLYVPILSPDNLSCIATKIAQEQKNIIQANVECLALDPRASSNALGLNTEVEAINKIKVILSEDYVDQL